MIRRLLGGIVWLIAAVSVTITVLVLGLALALVFIGGSALVLL